MCYGDEARPPLPPISGAAADHGETTLSATDGNRLMAHYARASKPTGAGMVVLPDVRGLHDFYKELALRFAETGIDAVAIDYFGRTAGKGKRDESFEWQPHVQATTPAGIDADVAAGAAYLRSPEGGGVKAVFTVGFCFGGSNSWRQSATGPDLSGVVGFYGNPDAVRPLIPGMKAPLLLLVAGADFRPLDQFQALDRELTSAGVPHEMQVYAGAPHSFFDRAYAEWQDACTDAWQRILDFVAKHRG